VVLRDGGSVLDALGYCVFAPGEVNAGEGAPDADPAAGASLARRFADVDTGDNAADFIPAAHTRLAPSAPCPSRAAHVARSGAGRPRSGAAARAAA
jgi:hypothetical protein